MYFYLSLLKKINIHSELVTSNLTVFLVPSLIFLNFQSSITFLFEVRFAVPNSLVLETLSFGHGLVVSDPFPLNEIK